MAKPCEPIPMPYAKINCEPKVELESSGRNSKRSKKKDKKKKDKEEQENM